MCFPWVLAIIDSRQGGIWKINENIRNEITVYFRRLWGDQATFYYLVAVSQLWMKASVLEEVGLQSPANKGQSGYGNWTRQELDLDYRVTGYRRVNVTHLQIVLRLWPKAFCNSWEHWGVRRLNPLFLRTCPPKSKSPWESLCPL